MLPSPQQSQGHTPALKPRVPALSPIERLGLRAAPQQRSHVQAEPQPALPAAAFSPLGREIPGHAVLGSKAGRETPPCWPQRQRCPFPRADTTSRLGFTSSACIAI